MTNRGAWANVSRRKRGEWSGVERDTLAHTKRLAEPLRPCRDCYAGLGGKGDALRLMTNEGDIKQGQGRVEEGRLGVCLPSSSGSSKRGGGPPSMAKRGKMEREGKQLCVNGWNNGTGRVGGRLCVVGTEL